VLTGNLRLLFRLFWRPVAAMSAILDQGSLLVASLAAAAVGFALPWSSFYTPLLVLAVVYVPGTLLLTRLLAGGADFGRDYAPLLTCAAMAWTAANLPVVVAVWLGPLPVAFIVALPAQLYFGVLMFFAVRTVFGMGNGTAAAVVLLSWIPLIAGVFLLMQLRFLLGWLASPFFLLFAYYYLGSEIGGLGAGLRNRQHFRRMLEASTVNPHDSDAQYQLGLIYQQRREYTEAIRRFTNAVTIDPGETDAHFQLGRIAREQGRLHDALDRFQTVLDQDDKHSQNEILRELGAVYVTARQYEDARNELAEYVERRPYDPEGLFYYGQALDGLGRREEARQAYQRAVDAVRTAPRYRRRIVAKWGRLAHRQLRKL
jgi:tetratricopeptide (TPR) repeat protein